MSRLTLSAKSDAQAVIQEAEALEWETQRAMEDWSEEAGDGFGGIAEGRGDPVAEVDAVARLQPLGVADEGDPVARPFALVQRRADLCLPVGAAAFELGGDHAGIVEHQHIAGVEKARQIAHAPVFKRRVGPAHHQHPRRIARAHRAQRNAFIRQVEIEKVHFHGARP